MERRTVQQGAHLYLCENIEDTRSFSCVDSLTAALPGLFQMCMQR